MRYRGCSVYLKVGWGRKTQLSLSNESLKWVQMQEFYSLTFLDVQKVHFQDTENHLWEKLHYFQELKEWTLKAQWQIWDFLQGANSLGVNFKRKILAWYDKLFASYNTYFVKRGRVPLFSLNELGEKSVN